jgi:NADPH:quinone reductase-like Zn-dependent oxidoreductase
MERIVQAIQISEFGGADVVQIKSVSAPQLRDHDVLVRVIASGVNPVEWKIREGHMARMLGRPLPAVLGWECAGVVDRIGAAVTRFKVGDAVFAYPEFTRDGTHAEYVAIDERQVALKPASLSFTQAAGAALTSQAAWAALAAADLKEGNRVLVHGAGGSVGHFLLQLSKTKGIVIVATALRPEIDAVHALGADEVVDYTERRFEDLGRFEVVFDLVGGETQTRSWAILERHGRLVSTASPPSADMAKAADATGIFVFTAPDGDILQQIATKFDDETLRPLPIAKKFSLYQAAQAHQLGQTGKAGGKMVLDIAQV